MDTIIEAFSQNQFLRFGSRNKIIGGIGTIEGRILVAFKNRKLVRMPIIASDRNIPVPQPINALQNLERGPTGNHDLIVGNEATVQLLYCHQTICWVDGGGNVSLCGRTHLMFSDIREDNDSGDDETQEHELKTGEHLRLIWGTVRVRVSAAGHRIYVTECVKYEKFFTHVV